MERNVGQMRFSRWVKKKWPLYFFLATKVPAGFFGGMRVASFSPKLCETTMPFWFFTKNPFKSMYFASQCMAAELSTALPILYAMEGFDEKIAYIIIENQAKYHQKAKSKLTFSCMVTEQLTNNLMLAIESKQPQTYRAYSVAKNQVGEVVSEFWFTWSFVVKS